MGWTILDTNKLRQIDLFAGLSELALEKVAAITYTRPCRRGEKIFSDGDPGQAMYMIMQGEVRISKSIPGLGEEALAILGEGSYFGEMSLLEDEEGERSADAWASKTCQLTVINKADLQDLMRRDAGLEVELLRSFVQTLSRRLREANSKVTFLAAAGKF
jgi:CRP/FNR family cyclic AMP-dependent transcriptional regulator